MQIAYQDFQAYLKLYPRASLSQRKLKDGICIVLSPLKPVHRRVRNRIILRHYASLVIHNMAIAQPKLD